MTRKDYIKIAEALKRARKVFYSNDAGERKAMEYGTTECVLNIAEVLQADNPNFNRSKFLVACGIDV